MSQKKTLLEARMSQIEHEFKILGGYRLGVVCKASASSAQDLNGFFWVQNGQSLHCER